MKVSRSKTIAKDKKCVHCGSKNVVSHGRHLSASSERRVERESSPEYQRHMATSRPTLYESTVRDNGGGWPTRKQLRRWYSSQRYLCRRCKKTFIEDIGPTDTGADGKRIASLTRILREYLLKEKFISQREFIRLNRYIEIDPKNPELSVEKINRSGNPEHQYDPAVLRAVYDKLLRKSRLSFVIPKAARKQHATYIFKATKQIRASKVSIALIVAFDLESGFIRVFETNDLMPFAKYLASRYKPITAGVTPKFWQQLISILPEENVRRLKKRSALSAMPEIESLVLKRLKNYGFDTCFKVSSSDEATTIALNFFQFFQYVWDRDRPK